MIRHLIERFGAWRRGEVRTAPTSVRGRVYLPKDQAGAVSARGRPKGSIRARVWRAATGQWEDLGVIAKPEED